LIAVPVQAAAATVNINATIVATGSGTMNQTGAYQWTFSGSSLGPSPSGGAFTLTDLFYPTYVGPTPPGGLAQYATMSFTDGAGNSISTSLFTFPVIAGGFYGGPFSWSDFLGPATGAWAPAAGHRYTFTGVVTPLPGPLQSAVLTGQLKVSV
jgi:hypothetical protein